MSSVNENDVERRGDDVARDGAGHAPRSAAAGSRGGGDTCASACGVSSDTGRMHSSGVTPPCRNEPRYRLWYSRSFVG